MNKFFSACNPRLFLLNLSCVLTCALLFYADAQFKAEFLRHCPPLMPDWPLTSINERKSPSLERRRERELWKIIRRDVISILIFRSALPLVWYFPIIILAFDQTSLEINAGLLRMSKFPLPNINICLKFWMRSKNQASIFHSFLFPIISRQALHLAAVIGKPVLRQRRARKRPFISPYILPYYQFSCHINSYNDTSRRICQH
jgi:hypothetical protein